MGVDNAVVAAKRGAKRLVRGCFRHPKSPVWTLCAVVPNQARSMGRTRLRITSLPTHRFHLCTSACSMPRKPMAGIRAQGQRGLRDEVVKHGDRPGAWQIGLRMSRRNRGRYLWPHKPAPKSSHIPISLGRFRLNVFRANCLARSDLEFTVHTPPRIPVANPTCRRPPEAESDLTLFSCNTIIVT